MQTAMQDHLQWLYDNQLELNIPIEVIEDAEDRLEMEKQQIINAFDNGVHVRHNDYSTISEQYYNETYGSNESDEVEFYKKELEDERNRVASSQTEISDEPYSTITDKIDGMIFELPFDDKMKLWELIDELVAESQTEISDEEIEKCNYTFFKDGTYFIADEISFKEGAKWYREQLKKKQCI